VRIHHVAFRTKDLPRLLAFYTELLDFSVARSTDSGVWLDAGGAIVMLERASAEEPDVPPGSMEIVVFAMAPRERARFVEKLGARGVAIEGETRFSIYFRDPDGRRIGLSHFPEPAAD
jgi:catechol 2,3-dioxygenase-like lactoylglutathione lyase family enzyme